MIYVISKSHFGYPQKSSRNAKTVHQSWHYLKLTPAAITRHTAYAEGSQSFHWTFIFPAKLCTAVCSAWLHFQRVFFCMQYAFDWKKKIHSLLEESFPRLCDGLEIVRLRGMWVHISHLCYIVWLCTQMGTSLKAYWRKLSALIWPFHWKPGGTTLLMITLWNKLRMFDVWVDKYEKQTQHITYKARGKLESDINMCPG